MAGNRPSLSLPGVPAKVRLPSELQPSQDLTAICAQGLTRPNDDRGVASRGGLPMIALGHPSARRT